ncbi:glycosyltransferase [Vibrio mexicanus]|uniref:glycosyltransferase n=1 Tax=Vibrio mexicanus TaxID=1004326 RepID=UPI0009FFB68B|nr:glycosyltransferase [Vibrio mexicanus]
MMKILLMTIGSRGDVEPFIALGKAMKKKGHEVELCTAQRFKPMVIEHDLSHQPITDELFELIEGDTFESMGSLFSGVKTSIRLMKASKPIQKQMIIDCIKAGLTVKPNLIIFHPKCLAAVSIAESLRIPAVMAALQPMTVNTRDFPPAGMPDLGGWFNRWSYTLVSLGFKQFSKELNRQRQAKLDLPRFGKSDAVTTYRDGKAVEVIHAFSEAVIPRPNDWPESAFISGYWQLEFDPQATNPHKNLLSF